MKQKYEFLSTEEHQALFNAIYDWRTNCKATYNGDETYADVYKRSRVDADTPYCSELLPEAKERNLAHIRELDIKSFWKKANAAGW